MVASSPPTTPAPPPTTTPERPFLEIQPKNIFDTPIFRQRDNNTIQFTDKGNIVTINFMAILCSLFIIKPNYTGPIILWICTQTIFTLGTSMNKKRQKNKGTNEQNTHYFTLFIFGFQVWNINQISMKSTNLNKSHKLTAPARSLNGLRRTSLIHRVSALHFYGFLEEFLTIIEIVRSFHGMKKFKSINFHHFLLLFFFCFFFNFFFLLFCLFFIRRCIISEWPAKSIKIDHIFRRIPIPDIVNLFGNCNDIIINFVISLKNA